MDISKKSIDYADKSAKEKSLNIRYINASYLDLDLGEEQYDLITLIYTDLGVLVPKDRITLLNKVYKALKPGGVFVFDLLKRKEMEKRLSPKSWEAAEQGFWKSTPYLALSESFFYEENDVILYQHTIIDANDVAEIYRFWTHFFEVEDINKMLSVYKYSSLEFRDDILPEGNIWNGKNVIFTVAVK